ncbi:MAG: hypothetical protein HOV79_13005 [Hamadaea sp.]|nr:hypothetical protein [Hamadaea sp.]
MNIELPLTVGELYLALIAVALIVAVGTSLVAHLRGREIRALHTYVLRWTRLEHDLTAATAPTSPAVASVGSVLGRRDPDRAARLRRARDRRTRPAGRHRAVAR